MQIHFWCFLSHFSEEAGATQMLYCIKFLLLSDEITACLEMSKIIWLCRFGAFDRCMHRRSVYLFARRHFNFFVKSVVVGGECCLAVLYIRLILPNIHSKFMSKSVFWVLVCQAGCHYACVVGSIVVWYCSHSVMCPCEWISYQVLLLLTSCNENLKIGLFQCKI